MKFILYTDKTVAQCLAALNARMQLKGTSTRPALDGWVQKGGDFSIGASSNVVGRFSRATYLRGTLERQGGYTVVTCRVPNGATRENLMVIYAALALIALVLLLNGNTMPALVVIPVAAALYVPLTGDYHNSQYLIGELQKTLKAKPTPPKAAAAKKPAEARRAPAASRPAAPRAAPKASPAPALLKPEPTREPLPDAEPDSDDEAV